MSDMSVNVSSKNTGTVFLIDVSESFASEREAAAGMVREALKELPDGDRAAVIAFGADARVEQFMSETNMFTGVETMPVLSATNIENAARAGSALFDDNEAKRMVLITDGNQNEGQLEKMGAVLASENVDVNVIQKKPGITDEAYISDLEVPGKIQAGDKFKVEVKVESTVKTNAILQLYTGGKLSRQEDVTLQEGSNSFIFQDTRKKEGFAEYKAVIIPQKDTISINNEYSAYTEAGGTDRVLIIESVKNEASEFYKLLSSANIKADIANASAAPSALDRMNKYKCIILENTPYENLPQGFIKSLASYVKDYGGGFIVTGGKKSFAPGGYKNTPLEDVLPVNMDVSQEKKIPDMAMVMVIDKSGSMQMGDSGNNKIDMAKDAAAGAADNLRDTDSVGVLSFDDKYGWNVEIQKAGNKEDIKSGIYGISGGGGTSIYPALREAYDKIKDTDCQLKHIILLTDGQDTFYDAYPGLLKKLEESQVTLSTVSIGTDADDSFLEKLANAGGGRYYNTKAGTGLSRIFAQEVYLAQKEYIVNRVFTPLIKNTGSILDTELQDGLPAMAGYTATSIKPEAIQVLSSDQDNDPVLACWQYGLGRTAAFTSDVTNQWTGNYASWSGYPAFWKGIINWVTDIAEDGGSKVEVAQEGSKGKIVYTTPEYSAETKVIATITDEEGKKTETELKAISPGIYEGETELEDTGVYSVNIQNTQNGTVKDARNTKLAMQYSQEYRFEKETGNLDTFVNQSGGRYIKDLDGIFDTKLEKVYANKNITLHLLITCVVLLLADITYRRLDIKPGAKLVAAIQDKLMYVNRIKDRVMAAVPASNKIKDTGKGSTILNSTAADKVPDSTAGNVTPAKAKDNAAASNKAVNTKKAPGKEKRKDTKQDSEELLDVGSLLKKQKERGW